jgi:Fe-S-cluster-containing hydrogenase component 2
LTFSTRVKKAISCDLCDGEPECINFCATGALEFKEENAATAMALKNRVAKAKKNQVAEKT